VGFAEALRKPAARALRLDGDPAVGRWPVVVISERRRLQAHGVADGLAEAVQALDRTGLDAEKIDQDVHIFVDDRLQVSVAAIMEHLVPVRAFAAEETSKEQDALRHIE